MSGTRSTHEWQARANEVDFLRNNGGFYAVSLTLSVDDVRRLRKNLQECLKIAGRFGKNDIEIIAHWGKKAKSAGEKEGWLPAENADQAIAGSVSAVMGRCPSTLRLKCLE